MEQRAVHLCPTTSPLSPSLPHLVKCSTRQIKLCKVGQRRRGDTFLLPHTHIAHHFAIPYLDIYLLIDPICAYLICPPIFQSQTISPSLFWSPLYLSRHRPIMDRSLHRYYSISLITLSRFGRPINVLTQMDAAAT